MSRKHETIEDVLKRRAWPYGRVRLHDFLFGAYTLYEKCGRRRKHKRNRQGDCKRAWGL